MRCVRRAYLCGEDYSTGENYDHRKQWIVSRLRFLSYVFAVDVCAYAVMSNHYHVVLHADKARALAWSDAEVAQRWMQLYTGHVLVDRWLADPGAIDAPTQDVVDGIIATWRKRLYDISWFMRGVNETVARMANNEEGCKGRFWEGRFKSQALLDAGALLSCMAYVDLNPIRADMKSDLMTSDFTSIQQRLFDYVTDKNIEPSGGQELDARVRKQRELKAEMGLDRLPEAPLMPFDGSSHTSVNHALPFTREDYFALVEATGRIIRDDKRGYIASDIPDIVVRLGINPLKWIDHVQNFGRRYGSSAGSVSHMADFARVFERNCGKGVSNSHALYLRAG